MQIEFDPDKDAANIAKHGVSLARSVDLDVLAYVEDRRFAEPRFRLYGMIDGEAYCWRGRIVAGSSARSASAAPMPRRCAAMSSKPAVVFRRRQP